MKTLKTIITILVVSLFSISCSKDDHKTESITYAE